MSVTFIEYSAFYGSLEIIKNIRSKGVDFPKKIWSRAINSENAELIQYLENNNFKEILYMSIYCHHNNISKYIFNNYINEEDLKDRNEKSCFLNFYRSCFECHNYCFFPKDTKYKNILFYLYNFNYPWLVKLLIQDSKIDVNAKSI